MAGGGSEIPMSPIERQQRENANTVLNDVTHRVRSIRQTYEKNLLNPENQKALENQREQSIATGAETAAQNIREKQSGMAPDSSQSVLRDIGLSDATATARSQAQQQAKAETTGSWIQGLAEVSNRGQGILNRSLQLGDRASSRQALAYQRAAGKNERDISGNMALLGAAGGAVSSLGGMAGSKGGIVTTPLAETAPIGAPTALPGSE